jgi:hypothetical protein
MSISTQFGYLSIQTLREQSGDSCFILTLFLQLSLRREPYLVRQGTHPVRRDTTKCAPAPSANASTKWTYL